MPPKSAPPPADTPVPGDLLTRENTPGVWVAILITGTRAHALFGISHRGRPADILAAARAARAAVGDLDALFSRYARYDLSAATNAADTLESAAAMCALAADRIRRRAAGHGDENPGAPTHARSRAATLACCDGWSEHAGDLLAAVSGVVEAARELLGDRLGLRDRKRLVRAPQEAAILAREAARRRGAADDVGEA